MVSDNTQENTGYSTDSILGSVKKLLGIQHGYHHFDAEVEMHINSVFGTLKQLGIGPGKGFSISGAETKWDEFLDDAELLGTVKIYIYNKVRIIFDPPHTSYLIENIRKAIDEAEWRLSIHKKGDHEQ